MPTRRTPGHFATPVDQSLFNTIFGIFQAARTVVFVPAHDARALVGAGKKLRAAPQPVYEPVDEAVASMGAVCRNIDTAHVPQLNQRELIGLTGVLMQFMTFVPKLHPYARTPFADTEALYRAIIAAGRRRPLSFADQLAVALEQTTNDLPEALWRLLITARLYARWLDTEIITGLPEFSLDEVVERMFAWSKAVSACKPYGSLPDQDAGGDTYYVWTHALAKVAFYKLARHQSPLTKLEILALHNGTRLNRNIANRVSPPSVPIDHRIAAAYGNAIGKRLVDILSERQRDKK